MKKSIVLALCLGCASSVQKSVQLDQTEAKHEATAENAVASSAETRHQEASDIKQEVERDDRAVLAEEPDGTIHVARLTAKTPLVFPKGTKVGTLDMGGTTMKRDAQIGAQTDQKTADLKTAKTDDIDATKTDKSKGEELDKSSVGPGWRFYAWITLVFILAAAAVGIYFRLTKRVRWPL